VFGDPANLSDAYYQAQHLGLGLGLGGIMIKAAAFVVRYCEQQGIDTRDLRVETAFEKNEQPAFLTNFKVDVHLPHAECGDRMAAVKRVADHCIIEETLQHFQNVQIRIHDKANV
jgi:uncharacterized OsmC-like protein